jgi:transglutaminase-like putative cysteine protease
MKYIAIVLSVLALASCQNFMALDYDPVQVPAGVVDLETAFYWVSTNIEFVDDFRPIWQGPHTTLRIRTGNCEAMAILLATLCDQLGYDARYVVGSGHDGGSGHAVAKIDGVLYDCVPVLTSDGQRPATFEPDTTDYDIIYEGGIDEVLRNCDSE